jgi:hypothetical protein
VVFFQIDPATVEGNFVEVTGVSQGKYYVGEELEGTTVKAFIASDAVAAKEVKDADKQTLDSKSVKVTVAEIKDGYLTKVNVAVSGNYVDKSATSLKEVGLTGLPAILANLIKLNLLLFIIVLLFNRFVY